MRKEQNVKKNNPKKENIKNCSTDVYKSGGLYGTISPVELYKSGGLYGVISIRDFKSYNVTS